MNKVEEILFKIGINKQESRVYLALLNLREAKTGELCNLTHIASSNIYPLLTSLIKKGLVSYKLKNNIKIFMSSPPESLNELFLEKQKKLEEERKEISKLITNLKKRDIDEGNFSNYKYYEGISGVKSMWYEINNIMKKDILIKIYTGKKESCERLFGFYLEHHKLRKQQKIKERMIYPIKDRDLANKRKNNLTEIKFSNLKNDAEWGVLGDVFFIQTSIGKKPHSFLIKDKFFASTFEQIFDQLWKAAK